MYEGFKNVRLVGQTGDHGADVTATKFGKRWLFQAKHWKKPIGMGVVEETLSAAAEYRAAIPVIVSSMGFEAAVKETEVSAYPFNSPAALGFRHFDSTL